MNRLQDIYHNTYHSCKEVQRALPFVRSTYPVTQSALCELMKYCARQRAKYHVINMEKYLEFCHVIALVEQTAENHFFALAHQIAAARVERGEPIDIPE